MRRLLLLAVLVSALPGSLAGAAAQSKPPRTVVDFYMRLPQKYFDIAPYQRGPWLKEPGTIVDIPHGYLRVMPNASQMQMEICLFKRRAGSYLVAISNDGWDDPERLGLLEILEYRGGRWKDVTYSVLPVRVDKTLVYRLPRIGKTIHVNHRSGRRIFELTWTGQRFRKTRPTRG